MVAHEGVFIPIKRGAIHLVLLFFSWCWIPDSLGAPLQIFTPNPEQLGLYGHAVIGIRDLNGNGWAEAVVGARNESPNGDPGNAGRVYIHDGLSGEVLRILRSPNADVQGFYGWALAIVPDVDGDGFEDLAIGAPGEEPSSQDSGRAYVFDARDGRLIHTLTAGSEILGDFFGWSVAGLEDLDGDGRGEILVGTRGGKVGGRAFVFSGASGEILRVLSSTTDQEESHFASSLGVVPDTNGDGYQDIVIGAHRGETEDTPLRAGVVYLFDSLTGDLLHTLTSPNVMNYGGFGFAVSGVPDVNGDGRGDVVVGALTENASATLREGGRAYVFDGSTGEILVELETAHPSGGGEFGHAVLGLPDVTGDGLGDVIVGAPSEDIRGFSRYGRAYLYDGASGDLVNTLFSLGPERNEKFGFSLGILPDSNGDLVPELAVGSPYYFTFGSDATLTGKATLFPSPLLPPQIEVSPMGPIDFGPIDVRAGPLPPKRIRLTNGGVGQLVIRENGLSIEGADRAQFSLTFPKTIAPTPVNATFEIEIVFDPTSLGVKEANLVLRTNDPAQPQLEILLFGTATDRSQLILRSPNAEEFGRFGHAVASLPDVNDNGAGEVIVGAWLEDPGLAPANAGRVHVYDGSTGEVLHTLFSPNEDIYFGSLFGNAVSGVPDTNGDGRWDILVGAYGETLVLDATYAGSAYLFDGFSGELLHSFFSPNAQFAGWFGWSVSGVPDLSGDGLGDVIVGADHEPRDARPIHTGYAYVFDGSSGALLHELESPNPEDDGRFGFSVSGIPDTNGDGRGDLIVGAFMEEHGVRFRQAGRAYIIDGSSGEFLHRLPKPGDPADDSSEQFFGSAVVGLSDINDDGRGDVVVGAPGVGAGVAFIYDGSSGAYLRTLEAPSNAINFGKSLSAVPDTNLDGYDEILVGTDNQAMLFDGFRGRFLWMFKSPNIELRGDFGFAVAGLPDADGDGRGDVVVGAQNEDPGPAPRDAGRAYVFYSPFLSPNLDVRPVSIDFGERLLDSSPVSSRTLLVENAGDLTLEFIPTIGIRLIENPDGNFSFANEPDLTPMDPGETREVSILFDPTSLGEKIAGVEFRSTDPVDPLITLELSGIGASLGIAILRSEDEVGRGRFGKSVAGIHDLNENGSGDLLVGGSRRVWALDGETREPIRELHSPERGAGFSTPTVSAVPDTNGDGIPEILVGDQWASLSESPDGAGAAFLFDGASGEVIHSVTSPLEEWMGFFGNSVSGIPDTNGDGRGDFIVGAFHEDPGPTAFDVGRAYIFDGSTGEPLHELFSEYQTFEAYFGYSVAGTADLSGDGLGDVIVGSPREGGPPYRYGRAYVFDGATGAHRRTLWPLETDPNDFGTAVAGIPDINGDRLADVAVAAPSDSLDAEGNNEGQVYVFDGFTGSLLYRLISPDPLRYGRFGKALAGLPDVTGDGRGDLIVGACGEAVGGNVYLFDGATGRWLESFSSPNAIPGGGFGIAVSGVPDTNGDGRWDLVIGAAYEDPGRSPLDAGRAYLFQTLVPFGLDANGLLGLVERLKAGELEVPILFRQTAAWMR